MTPQAFINKWEKDAMKDKIYNFYQSIKTSNKKVLTFLPSGIKTTPAWLFEEFTSSSLAKHGIRRLLKGHRTYNLASDEEIDNIEYMIQLADSDDGNSILNISKDTPITYLGFGKWEINGWRN